MAPPLRTFFSKFLLLCAFLCYETLASAQENELDSLRKRVEVLKGTDQIDALNALSFRQILINLKQADESLEQAFELSRKSNYGKGIAEATVYKGVSEVLKGNVKNGKALLIQGQQAAQQLEEFGLQGYALVQLGNSYRTQSKLDSAFFWYNKSYQVLKDSLNPGQLSVLYRNLAIYYNQKSEPRKQYEYLMRSLTIRQRLKDKVLLTDILLLLSQWHLSQPNLERALFYLSRAEEINADRNLIEIAIDIKYQKAMLYFRQSRYEEAFQLYEEVKKFYLSSGQTVPYIKSLLEIGELLEEIGNYDISLKDFYEALSLSEENGLVKEKILSLTGISRNYYRLKQSKLSIEFITKALQLAEKNSFKSELARVYNQFGLTLKADTRFEEAEQYLLKALRIRVELNDIKGQGATLANIGETLQGLNRLQEALQYHLRSVALKEQIMNQSGLAWGYFDLGSVYAKLKEFKKATFFLQKAELAAKISRNGIVLANTYQVRRDIFSQEGNPSQALRYSIIYEHLKDSVYTAAFTNRIVSLQGTFELDRKNREIELLNKDKQVQQEQLASQQAELRNREYILILMFLAIGLMALLFINSWRASIKRKRLYKEIQDQNEEIQAQSEELTETNDALQELNKELAIRHEEVLTQAEELTEANTTLQELYDSIHKSQEELKSQSQQLEKANAELLMLNFQLAEQQEELQAQSEELRESNHMISLLNDGLEQKVKDRTAQLQQAYTDLDTFFYRSSHDFRRPLTTFMGLAEVAKITVKDSFALDLFSKVRETAVNLDRMLMKLQSISDVGSEQFVAKTIVMASFISSVLDTYRLEIEAVGIKVITRNVHVKTFSGYPAFLKIILENLIENSIQFRSPSNPSITIEVKEDEENITILVKDNGQGVEEEYQERLFDMFFRGNEQSKGNGLGLYIVKKAVEKMKGQVVLESTYRIGTQVTIWLPKIDHQ